MFRIANAQTDHFDLVTSRVASLLQEDDNEYLPTPETVRRALQLLNDARPRVHTNFPRATAATDSAGGVNVIWSSPTKELRLAISARADGAGYIYHEQGDDFAIDRDVSAGNLARWLRWFSDV